MPLDRTWFDALIDDSGDNESGSVIAKEDFDSLLDSIDEAMDALFDGPVLFDSTVQATGFHLVDTDASHVLKLVAGSNLSADRTLTITPGDAARTITLTGSPTLADWFDQGVKTTSGPTFANLVTTAGIACGGGQIGFPSTQNPSADANTLDDYEEGTYTPGLSFGGGTTGLTYATQTGGYIKIGRLVLAMGTLVLTNKGSSTGAARLTGLPFTSASGTEHYSVIGGFYHTALASLVDGPKGLIDLSATTVSLFNGGAADVVALTEANFTNTSQIAWCVAYRASA